MTEKTLAENAIYKSIENVDGSIEISLTWNGGVTYAHATVHKNGRVEGERDDLRMIVADCADVPFDEVDDTVKKSGLSLEEWIVGQAENDQATAQMHDEALLDE